MNEIYAYWISFAKITVLVIFSCKIWQMAVFFFLRITNGSVTRLTNGNVTRLTNANFSILTNGKYTQYDRCKSYHIVCTSLHAGHHAKSFAMKRCTKPVHHIFPWLSCKGTQLPLCIRVFSLKRLRWRDAQNLRATFFLGLAVKEPSPRFAYGCSVWNVCDECFIQRNTLMFFLIW